MATRRGNGGKIAAGVVAFGLLALAIKAASDKAEAERERLAREQRETERAKQLVMSAVHRIAALLGVPIPHVIFDGCANAATDGKTICFSIAWARGEMSASCKYGTCVSNRVLAVVAHEFGHIIDPDLRTGHKWHDEYRADHVAGWCLGKLGVSPTDFLALMRNWSASSTHPPGVWRIPHVIEGFEVATAVRFSLPTAFASV